MNSITSESEASLIECLTDLIGIPLQIICGNSFKKNREISILKRANKDQINIDVVNAMDTIIKMIGCNE